MASNLAQIRPRHQIGSDGTTGACRARSDQMAPFSACMQAAAGGGSGAWHLALHCAGAAAGSMASVPSIGVASAALCAAGAGAVSPGAVLRRCMPAVAAAVAVTTVVAALAAL